MTGWQIVALGVVAVVSAWQAVQAYRDAKRWKAWNKEVDAYFDKYGRP